MSDQRPVHVTSDELEQSLDAMRSRVRFPVTPNMTHAVRARIPAPAGAASPRPAYRVWFHPRRVAIAAAAMILVVIGALVAFPEARTSIAKRFGVHGIEIIFMDETPTPATSPVGATLVLGDATTLTEAQASVEFSIQAPGRYGSPDEIYLRTVPSGPIVSLLYLPGPDLPAAQETGIGGLLMQFATTNHPATIAKRVSLGSGSVREVVMENGVGYWVTGETELVIYQDPTEGFEDFVSRDSANILLWEDDGVTYRFESALSLEEAILVAESMLPVELE